MWRRLKRMSHGESVRVGLASRLRHCFGLVYPRGRRCRVDHREEAQQGGLREIWNVMDLVCRRRKSQRSACLYGRFGKATGGLTASRGLSRIAAVLVGTTVGRRDWRLAGIVPSWVRCRPPPPSQMCLPWAWFASALQQSLACAMWSFRLQLQVACRRRLLEGGWCWEMTALMCWPTSGEAEESNRGCPGPRLGVKQAGA